MAGLAILKVNSDRDTTFIDNFVPFIAHVLFAGSLDLTTMNIFEKLFVLLVVGATPSDGRNWKAIREWGAGLGKVLQA